MNNTKGHPSSNGNSNNPTPRPRPTIQIINEGSEKSILKGTSKK